MLALIASFVPLTAKITYDSGIRAGKVVVLGDFNHWDPPGLKMNATSNGFEWNLDLKLEPGAYRYVCIEDGRTIPTGDAYNKALKWLILPPADYANKPGELDDGIITASGLAHWPDGRSTSRINDRTFELTFRTRHNDVRSVSAAVSQPGSEEKVYPMVLSGGDPVFDQFKVKIVINPDKAFLYRFMVNDGRGSRAFDTAGLSDGVIGGGDPFRQDPHAYPVPIVGKKKG